MTRYEKSIKKTHSLSGVSVYFCIPPYLSIELGSTTSPQPHAAAIFLLTVKTQFHQPHPQCPRYSVNPWMYAEFGPSSMLGSGEMQKYTDTPFITRQGASFFILWLLFTLYSSGVSLLFIAEQLVFFLPHCVACSSCPNTRGLW